MRGVVGVVGVGGCGDVCGGGLSREIKGWIRTCESTGCTSRPLDDVGGKVQANHTHAHHAQRTSWESRPAVERAGVCVWGADRESCWTRIRRVVGHGFGNT